MPQVASLVPCSTYAYVHVLAKSASLHTQTTLVGKGNLIFISYYKDAEIKPCVEHDNPRQTLFGVFKWDQNTLVMLLLLPHYLFICIFPLL
jgi:hypothetical protein